MRTRIHWKHGVPIINSLVELYCRNLPPFDRPDAVLPQDPAHMPPSLPLGGIAHRMFLFTVNYYMRGGIDSNTAVKLLAIVYERHPEYFDPFWVVNHLQEDELRAVLESVGLNYSKARVPSFWIENCRRLVIRYQGDPGRIFDGISTYEEACLRIRNDHKGGGFQGFQQKMVSMVTYFFMDAGFISPFNFPIPVDIHVARITLSNGIVTFPGLPTEANVLRLVGGKEVALDAARKFYLWYSTTHEVDPLLLCNAVWMYSRLRCAENPENEWERFGEHANRKSKVRKLPVDWGNPTVYDRWRRSCGLCPVQKTCGFNIGAMPYYTRGEIRLNDPRTGPPADIQQQIGLLWPSDQDAAYSQDRPAKPPVADKSAGPSPAQISLDLD